VGDLFGVTFAALLKMYTFYANNYIAVRTPHHICHDADEACDDASCCPVTDRLLPFS